MMFYLNPSEFWRIARKKKKDRTDKEQYQFKADIIEAIRFPFTIVLFPIALVIKLYRWTYYGDDN